ncbi:hypothetical protein niasHT_035318 [Heterodera trifolii]|uniref:Uncharacterized protein n=1 Tax=Heterodera trifolii TaxID=157864 RepID=A0ABD2HYP2_9BILA
MFFNFCADLGKQLVPIGGESGGQMGRQIVQHVGGQIVKHVGGKILEDIGEVVQCAVPPLTLGTLVAGGTVAVGCKAFNAWEESKKEEVKNASKVKKASEVKKVPEEVVTASKVCTAIIVVWKLAKNVYELYEDEQVHYQKEEDLKEEQELFDRQKHRMTEEEKRAVEQRLSRKKKQLKEEETKLHGILLFEFFYTFSSLPHW